MAGYESLSYSPWVRYVCDTGYTLMTGDTVYTLMIGVGGNKYCVPNYQVGIFIPGINTISTSAPTN
jgi:hypothetical protein